MSTTKNKRAIIVGVFILLGIIILMVGVLTLGGQQKTFDKTFVLSATFDDVSGLQTGNNIWYSGVKVGTVKKIALHGNSQVAVTMNIDKQAQQFIRKDAKAKIGSEGLIGNKIIIIYGGTPTIPSVSDGDMLGVEKALNTDDMMSTLQENNKNLQAITGDFKQISRRLVEGQGTIGKLLTDETLANRLQSAITVLNRASDNAANLTSNLAAYTQKLQSKGTLANDLVTDTVVFNSLRNTVAQFQQASVTANNVASDLKQVSNNLNNTNSAAGTLLNDPQAANNIKTILQNLQSGSQKLDDDLEALQHNFLLRGFFRKRAKAQAEEVKVKEKEK